MTPQEIEHHRGELALLIPDAIRAIAVCIRKPGRNAQVQLTAARMVLDRVGLPAIAATTISAPGGGPLESKLTVEFVRAPARIVEAPKEIE